MAKSTKIQWCDSTVNPVMGCAGCELWTEGNHTCYAGRIHRRHRNNPGFAPSFEKPKLFPGRMLEAADWADLSGTDRPNKPWLSGLPRIIFVSDMGDALSERGIHDPENQPVDDRQLFPYLEREIIDVVGSEAGVLHQWLWLTKRPNRLATFLASLSGRQVPANLWLGTSVTSKASLNRVAQLESLGDDQTIRFVSVEPLWEEVTFGRLLKGIHWMILGGESGYRSRARRFDCRWARRLIDECQSAGVPLFIKQLGAHVLHEGRRLELLDSHHGGDWSEWPKKLRIRQMPVARIRQGT